jgi:hypothetical protein
VTVSTLEALTNAQAGKPGLPGGRQLTSRASCRYIQRSESSEILKVFG